MDLESDSRVWTADFKKDDNKENVPHDCGKVLWYLATGKISAGTPSRHGGPAQTWSMMAIIGL